MKVNNQKLVDRWNKLMYDLCLENETINSRLSELEEHKEYYGIVDGISTDWMLKEAKNWLSCYYTSGFGRCDDRFTDKDCYKLWVSETGKLKRLIAKLEQIEEPYMVLEW